MLEATAQIALLFDSPSASGQNRLARLQDDPSFNLEVVPQDLDLRQFQEVLGSHPEKIGIVLVNVEAIEPAVHMARLVRQHLADCPVIFLAPSVLHDELKTAIRQIPRMGLGWSVRNPFAADLREVVHQQISAHRHKLARSATLDSLNRKLDKFETTSIDPRMANDQAGLFLEALATSSPIPFATIDHAGSVVTWSQGLENLLGYSAHEVLGRHLTKLLAVADRPRLNALLETMTKLKPEEPVVWEGALVSTAGRQLTCELTLVAVTDAQQRYLGKSVVIRDLTEHRAQEAVLREAKRQAERESRAKSTFLSTISHELRTPLGVIMGYIGLLLDEGVDAQEQQTILGTMRRNGAHLLQILNDLLDLSKAEAGRMEITPKLIQSAAFIKELQQTAAGIKRSAGVDLRFNTQQIPAMVIIDELRLRQIILNLLSNALKFTTAGYVELTLTATPNPDAGKLTLMAKVTDTGIGMSPEQQAKIFSPFYQAEAFIDRRHTGTGLGLALSRKLAEEMGGSLKLDRSAAGQGTTFCLHLPTKRAGRCDATALRPRSLASSTDGLSLQGVEVLIAEDQPDNRELLSLILRRQGARVVTAENGRVALELMTGKIYQVVIMDWQMPVMDGLTAVQEARRNGYEGAIICLSAHGMLEDRTQALEAGFTDYLIKPCSQAKLTETVLRNR